ncbi:hypothetical protein TRVA0_039S00232 [Trichomonascus vanleenenianus]|uniref:D-arabinose 1-dehydrogenase (NAD(P)(+)) ARA2 n=1 Tax=Trichomonascus vanleenenianus TaxID=2268995 RepID=UPI003ECB52D7
MEIKPLNSSSPKDLDDLPDIILGAGVFNYQYHDDPQSLAAKNVLKRAFDLGINALDTSAYYGPSEEIVGSALASLRDEYPREGYFICTKAGRVGLDDFDYRPSSIRASVERSLQRLGTKYIDLLYIHDVEFVATEQCLEAIGEAFKLKDEGVVRWVGLSGYPLDFMLYLAKRVLADLGRPLDAVLSYCNFCLQNTRLEKYSDGFKSEAKVKKLMNASPLSMSLLRSGPVHSFHPASDELKKAVSEAAKYTASKGVELADLASRFALQRWSGPTVFGLQTIEEVNAAVKYYWQSKDPKVNAEDEPLVEEVRRILGSQLDFVWSSGIDHPDMTN